MPRKSASPKGTKKLGSTKPKVKKEKAYKLEVHMNDEIFKHEGDTLLDCITSFINSADFPFAVKTKVFMKYGKGEVDRHKLVNVSAARTIFKRLRFDEDQARFLADKLTHELTA